MSAAAVRLECFGPSSLQPFKQELTAKAVEDAYQRGLCDGAERANADAINAARHEFRQLSEHLRSLESQHRQEFEKELGQVLVPMLDLLLDHVAPLGMRQRMSQFLTAELLRIEAAGTTEIATVKCPPHLFAELNDLVVTACVSNVRLEQHSNESSHVEVLIDQGAVTFNPDEFISDLQKIIKDIP